MSSLHLLQILLVLSLQAHGFNSYLRFLFLPTNLPLICEDVATAIRTGDNFDDDTVRKNSFERKPMLYTITLVRPFVYSIHILKLHFER